MTSEATNTPKKRFRKRRLFLFGCIWMFAIVLLLFLSVGWWVPPTMHFINKEKQYWDEFDFRISHIGPKHTKFEDLKFQKDNLLIQMESIQSNYDFNAFKNHRVKSVLIGATVVDIDLSKTAPNNTNTSQTKHASNFGDLTLPIIPFEDLSFNHTIFNLHTAPDQSFEFIASGHSEVSPPNLSLELQLQSGENRIVLEGNASHNKLSSGHVSAVFEFPDLLHTYNQLNPLFFPDTTVDIESIARSIQPLTGQVDWQVGSGEINLQTTVANVEFTDGSKLENTALDLDIDLTEMKWGAVLASEISYADRFATAIQSEIRIHQQNTDAPILESNWEIAPVILLQSQPENTSEHLLESLELQLQWDSQQIHLQIPEIASDYAPAKFVDITGSLPFSISGVSEPSAFRISGNILPNDPTIDWRTADDSTIITLNAVGQFKPQNFDIETTHSATTLTIPQTEFTFSPTADHYNPTIATHFSGKTVLKQTGAEAQINTQFDVDSFQLSQLFDTNLDMEGTLELAGTTSLTQDWEKLDWFKTIEDWDLKLQFNGSGRFTAFRFEGDKLRLDMPSLTPTRTTTGKDFSLSGDRFQWDSYKFLNIHSTGNLTPTGFDIKFESNLLAPSLFGKGHYTFNWGTGTQNGVLNIKNSEPTIPTTIPLHEILIGITTVFIKGFIASDIDLNIHHDTVAVAVNGSITDTSVTIPEAAVNISGINASSIKMKDLITGKSDGMQHVEIAEFDYAPYLVTNIQCDLQVETGYTVDIQHLKFNFCGGQFSIKFTEKLVAPYDSYAFEVTFKHLDLHKITQLIPDFKEVLTGTIEGYVPILIQAGTIAWGKGQLQLTPGTTAAMKYSEDGVFSRYIPKITISEELDLDINDALRDLTLTDLSVDIQPSSDFGHPTTVVMSGHSNNPTIHIPIERLQLNIRADDAPDLINKSFQMDKWLESLIFRK